MWWRNFNYFENPSCVSVLTNGIGILIYFSWFLYSNLKDFPILILCRYKTSWSCSYRRPRKIFVQLSKIILWLLTLRLNLDGSAYASRSVDSGLKLARDVMSVRDPPPSCLVWSASEICIFLTNKGIVIALLRVRAKICSILFESRVRDPAPNSP